jgi:hypothetical protein
MVLKAALLIVLTWKYGIWGACYGTVLAEIIFALITQLGMDSVQESLRLVWRISLPTIGTGVFVAALWWIGMHHWLSLVLSAVYLALAALWINRLLRTVRGHIPAAVADSERAADVVVSP